ncbi:MAG: beta strand repeat-containing protein, partial [Candidatus Rhabdochlamydia sp.]
MTGPFPRPIYSLAGNSGGAVGAAANGTLAIVGAGGITVSGSGNTLTISGSGGGGAAVPVPTGAGQIPISSGAGTYSTATLAAGPGINITPIAGSPGTITISATGSTLPNPTTAGQLIIGNGTAPVLGNLLGANGITINNGAGNITVGLPTSGATNGAVLSYNAGTSSYAPTSLSSALTSGITGTAPIVVTPSATGVVISTTPGTSTVPTPTIAGQIPISNGSSYVAATPSGLNGIIVTPGSGSLSIGLPTSGATNGAVLSYNAGTSSYVPTSLSSTLTSGITGTAPIVVTPSATGVVISTTPGTTTVPTPTIAGQIPISNGSSYVAATPSGLNGIIVTPGSGSLSIGLPTSGATNGAVLSYNAGTSSYAPTSLSSTLTSGITGTAPIVVTPSATGVVISTTPGTSTVPTPTIAGQIPIATNVGTYVAATPTGTNGVTITPGSGTLAIGLPPPTNGQLLIGNGTTLPGSYIAATLGVTGGLVTTPGPGTLSIGLPTAGATSGQVLTYNGTNYVPTSPSSILTSGITGTAPIVVTPSGTGVVISTTPGTTTVPTPTIAGQIPISNGSSYVAATPTGLNGVTITPGSGSLSIGLPTSGATNGAVLSYNSGTNSYVPTSLSSMLTSGITGTTPIVVTPSATGVVISLLAPTGANQVLIGNTGTGYALNTLNATQFTVSGGTVSLSPSASLPIPTGVGQIPISTGTSPNFTYTAATPTNTISLATGSSTSGIAINTGSGTINFSLIPPTAANQVLLSNNGTGGGYALATFDPTQFDFTTPNTIKIAAGAALPTTIGTAGQVLISNGTSPVWANITSTLATSGSSTSGITV